LLLLACVDSRLYDFVSAEMYGENLSFVYCEMSSLVLLYDFAESHSVKYHSGFPFHLIVKEKMVCWIVCSGQHDLYACCATPSL
jgi:hypothetical protein